MRNAGSTCWMMAIIIGAISRDANAISSLNLQLEIVVLCIGREATADRAGTFCLLILRVEWISINVAAFEFVCPRRWTSPRLFGANWLIATDDRGYRAHAMIFTSFPWRNATSTHVVNFDKKYNALYVTIRYSHAPEPYPSRLRSSTIQIARIYWLSPRSDSNIQNSILLLHAGIT